MRTGAALMLIALAQDRRIAVLDSRLEQAIRERVPRVAHESIRDLLKIGTPEAIEALLARAGDAARAEDAVRLRRHIVADRFWERHGRLEENERAGDPQCAALLDEARAATQSLRVVREIRREIYEALRPREEARNAAAARFKKTNFWLERAWLAGLLGRERELLERFGAEPEPTVQVAILDALSELPLSADIAALLARALGSEYGSMRFAALNAMRKLGDARFLDALVAAHPQSRGRYAAEIESIVRQISRRQAPRETSQWKEWWNAIRDRILKEGFQEPEQPVPQTQVVDFFTLPLNSVHLAFVIDCSESMKSSAKWNPEVVLGAKSDRLKPDGARRVDIAEYQLVRAFQNLPENSRFAVILFATGAETFESVPQTLAGDMRRRVREFVSKLPVKGNTDLFAGLDQALLYAGRRDGRIVKEGVDTIYLLSDGDASEGPLTNLATILEEAGHRNRWAKAAIHSIFIGRDGQQDQRQFMQDLSSANWGSYARATR
jgi:Mg-chelatase subunit ChlD